MTISIPAANAIPLASFQLKGRLHALTTLQLLKPELQQFEADLKSKISQAPAFFQHIPVIIEIKTAEDVNFQQLIEILRKNDLMPIGMCGGSTAQRVQAKAHGLPVLSDTSSSSSPAKTDAQKDKIHKNPNKIITTPVRSGQQIYAQGGDLIVLAPVSHGAEILADGNIHVYAPLRGRALAGIMGNTDTRIFCASLEAELVSIAGHYLVSEQLKNSGWKTAVQIACSDENLRIDQL